MKKKLKKFVHANWSLQEKALLAVDLLLFGVLIGWLTSPFRNCRVVLPECSYDVDDEEEEA